MSTSIVRIILNSFSWIAFGIGIILNGIMVYLIIRHTPKIMRIYSNILLQTCVTDIVLLIMTLLFQQFIFTNDRGELELITVGLITSAKKNQRGWHHFAAICWIFLVYVSLFSYTSQFIYRYLLLNWNKKMTTFKYFGLFFTMLAFPFAYCVDLYICYYPPADHAFLEDQSVANILGQNITTDQIALSGYSYKDWRLTMGIYYILIMCTIAYIIMVILAFLMDQFLKKQSKNTAFSSLTIKVVEMNKQISRNLAVQASMPFFIYLSLLFLLGIMLFKIDVSRWNWLQYYNFLAAIPMFLPSALNPIVSICIMQKYRKVFVNGIKQTVKALGRLSFIHQQAINDHQQQTSS